MCDYLVVSRQRRVVTISSKVRQPSATRSIGAHTAFAAACWRRRLVQCAIAVCTPERDACPAVPHRATWVDVAGHRILMYESIADDKSTVNAIATRLWRCALGTASWLAEQAPLFDGEVVLEVGAGTGLVTLTLAATSTARIISSDLEETAVALVRSAADHQALKLEEVIPFDLGAADAPLPSASWMLACDVMYTPELAAVLARRCAEQLRRGGHVLVTDPDRKPRAVFQATLDALLGTRTKFVRLQEAPPLIDVVNAAMSGGTPALVLLLVDEHCRPPFFAST
eukprot:2012364-Prymnesium_polylepis.1